jgi:hypothetical protein
VIPRRYTSARYFQRIARRLRACNQAKMPVEAVIDDAAANPGNPIVLEVKGERRSQPGHLSIAIS